MTEAVDELRDSLTGDVLVEGDRAYERARLCFNLLIDRRPAVIARCVDVDDVAAAFAFSRPLRHAGRERADPRPVPARDPSVLRRGGRDSHHLAFY